jgi:hypothetical protein
MIALGVFALVIVLGEWGQAQAQDPKAPYASMAPLDQYLMVDRDAEIAMTRSAAPEAISRDADVLVLERHGYETAVKGKSGFVCVVERSWMLPYDDPEFWNPKVRLPLCLNPPAAQSHLPLTFNQTEVAFSGMSKTQMFDRTKTAFDKSELPVPEPGSMCYMLSKQQNFGPKYGNADPHLMFWFPQKDHRIGAQIFLVRLRTYISTLRSQLPSLLFQRPCGRTERLHTRMFTDVRSQRAFRHDHAKKIVEIFRLGSQTVSQAVYTGRNRDG